MIRFDQGNRRFNYRIVGVAIHDDAVLLHRADHESFWTLPGGRAEHGETAEETIQREMREELETDVHVDRLLWIVENFFEYRRPELPRARALLSDSLSQRTLHFFARKPSIASTEV